MRSGNFVEARNAIEQGLQLARSLSDRRTEALGLLYLGAILRDEHIQEGIPFLEHSLALYRTLEDKIGQAAALYRLAWKKGRQASEDPKHVLFESLQLYRDLGNLTGIADCLNELAIQAVWQGDFSSPLPWLEEARKNYHDLGDQAGEAGIVNLFGTMAYGQGDYQKARAYFEESLALYGGVGVWWFIYPHVGLAYMDLRQGDIQKARVGFAEVIQRAHKNNLMDILVWATDGLASLQVNQREFECAARLFAWADVMIEKTSGSRPFIEQKFYERDLAVLHKELDEAEFAKFTAEGRAMTLEQTVKLALKLT